MFAVMGFGVYRSDGSLFGIGQVIYRLIFVTTVVGVILSLVYNRRTWCAFCPMGTLASLVSRFGARRGTRLLNVSSSCVSCSLCQKKCPVGIAPHAHKGDSLAHPDCIQCGICAATCPKKAIGY
jgi:polyferredoxin